MNPSDLQARPRLPMLQLPSKRVAKGLSVLVDAYHYSLDTASEVADFAVAYSVLREAGLTPVDLQWLIRKGRLQHLSNSGVLAERGFDDRSFFVLTDSGAGFALNLKEPADVSFEPRPRVPVWDESLRELRWDNHVVKRFRVPAPNQELILAVFQEESWPEHIFDPLPRSASVVPKRRLHDTITALNRNQTTPVLRFEGDGTGAGLRWMQAVG